MLAVATILAGLPAAAQSTAATIVAIAGSAQAALVGGTFPIPLEVEVTDSSGVPVSGVSVTFSAPSGQSGPSATFPGSGTSSTATTNAAGDATALPLQANGIAGTYDVYAGVDGVQEPATFSLTNLGPSTVEATAGSSQSALTGANFSTQLQATVTSSSGAPLAGVTVTFTAPQAASGAAAGTFAGGTNTATATTNSSGQATAPPFQANQIAGTYDVYAGVDGVQEPATFSLTNLGPSTVEATAGSSQSALTGANFSTQLQATVTSSSGAPLAGVTVTFTAPQAASGAAAGTFAGGTNTATATTNSSGQATAPPFQANQSAGTYEVYAGVAGIAGPGVFYLTNLGPSSVASIGNAAGRAGQEAAPIGRSFPDRLVAKVTAADGKPLSRVTVSFIAPSGGASAQFLGSGASAQVRTDSAGIAVSPPLSANGTAGRYHVYASVAGLDNPASFNLENLGAARLAAIGKAAGSNPQAATIGASFPYRLTVRVTAADGAPLEGVSVSFSAPAGNAAGASFAGGAAEASSTTAADGIAVAPPLSANGTAGRYHVYASVAGLDNPASFNLENLGAARLAAIGKAAGSNPQAATIGASFPYRLTVRVTAADGAPLEGVSVSFSAPAGNAAGASFAGGAAEASSTTAADGIAVAPPLSANGTAGRYHVYASVAGLDNPASFNLENLGAARLAAIGKAAGSNPQAATIGASFPYRLTVRVTAADGAPLEGVSVSFSAPAGNAAGASFAGGAAEASSTTAADGIAVAPPLSANGTAGRYHVYASVAGLDNPASFNLENLGAARLAAIGKAAGSNPQAATIGASFPYRLTVRVTAADGAPLEGVSVSFSAPAGNAAGASFAGGAAEASSTTAADGIAVAPPLSANGTAGRYHVYASVAGLDNPASFNLENLGAARLAAIGKAAGSNPQAATIGASFPYRLTVRVTAADGAPLEGVSVSFSAPAGNAAGASFAGGAAEASSTTAADGIAVAPPLSANGTAGRYHVYASVAGLDNPASFNLENLGAARLAAIGKAAGSNPQAATIGASFPYRLTVRVTAADGAPLEGVSVSFSAPAGNAAGASFAGGAAEASSTTAADGIAVAPPLSANGTAGRYHVYASVAGLDNPASFNLENLGAARLAVVNAPDEAEVGDGFAKRLAVRVTAADGAPLSGVSVSFSAPAGNAAGASFAGGAAEASSTTAADGIAVAPPLSANDTAGSYALTVSIPSTSVVTGVALRNLAAAPASVSEVFGSPQSALVGQPFAERLLVVVKDRFGNPVEGARVVFVAPPVGPGGSFLSAQGEPRGRVVVAVSDSAGQALSPRFMANAIPGADYQVVASVAGVVQSTSFGLSNVELVRP